MKTPKTQKELLAIIEDQDTQLRSLKQAMIRMEQKMRQIDVLAERSHGNGKRLEQRVNTIGSKLQELIQKLAR